MGESSKKEKKNTITVFSCRCLQMKSLAFYINVVTDNLIERTELINFLTI